MNAREIKNQLSIQGVIDRHLSHLLSCSNSVDGMRAVLVGAMHEAVDAAVSSLREFRELDLSVESMTAVEGLDHIMQGYALTLGRTPDAFMAEKVEATKERLFLWWATHRDEVRDLLVANAEQAKVATVAPSDAQVILTAMEAGWKIEKNLPASFLTEEANAATAWSASRYVGPFCDAQNTRVWQGATAIEALRRGQDALAIPSPLQASA